MTQSLSDFLQQSRLIVVSVDRTQGRVRVKSHADACTELSCGERTVVVADEAGGSGLETLNAGDVIRLEGAVADRPERIVVVRRVWDELTSPEF